MSYAIVHVIVGVPLNEAVSNKIREWEDEGDERWTDGHEGQCGFTTLYSASGGDLCGYCGVNIDALESYGNELVSNVRFEPTAEETANAKLLVEQLDPELRKLAGEFGVYFIWSDS